MKTIFDYNPDEIIDLGDGTYLENSNIEEFVDDDTGTTQWRADSVRKEWPKEPEVPIEVYAWRLRLATQMGGLKTTIDALLNSLPEPDKTIALEAWNSGVTIRRDSPLIASLATQLGLTKEQVDEYFIQANSIEI